MRTRSGLVFSAAIVLSSLQLAADCTDGVTPDCSDARCGAPSADAASEASVLPEAGTPDDASDPDAPADAPADASTDG